MNRWLSSLFLVINIVLVGIGSTIVSKPTDLSEESDLSLSKKDHEMVCLFKKILLDSKEKGTKSITDEECEEFLKVVAWVIQRAPRENSVSPFESSNDTLLGIHDLKKCICLIKKCTETIKEKLGCPDPDFNCDDVSCEDLETVFQYLLCICNSVQDVGSKICIVESIVDEIDDVICRKAESVIDELGITICEKVESATDALNETITDAAEPILSKVCVVESKIDEIDDVICQKAESVIVSLGETICEKVESATDALNETITDATGPILSKVCVVESTLNNLDLSICDHSASVIVSLGETICEKVESATDALNETITDATGPILSKVCVVESTLNNLDLSVCDHSASVIDSLSATICDKADSVIDQLGQTITDCCDTILECLSGEEGIKPCLEQLKTEVDQIAGATINIDQIFSKVCSIQEDLDEGVISKLCAVDSKIDDLGVTICDKAGSVIDQLGLTICDKIQNSTISAICDLTPVFETVCDKAESIIDSLGETITDATDPILSKVCVVESKLDNIEEAICDKAESIIDALGQTAVDQAVSIIDEIGITVVDHSVSIIDELGITICDKAESIINELADDVLPSFSKLCVVESKIDHATETIIDDLDTAISKICIVDDNVDATFSKVCVVNSTLDGIAETICAKASSVIEALGQTAVDQAVSIIDEIGITVVDHSVSIIDELGITICDKAESIINELADDVLPSFSKLCVVESKVDGLGVTICDKAGSVIDQLGLTICDKIENSTISAVCDLTPVFETVCDKAESIIDSLGETITESTDPIFSKLCVVESKVDDLDMAAGDTCSKIVIKQDDFTGIVPEYSIVTSGTYCLAEEITGKLTICTSNVIVDMNDQIINAVSGEPGIALCDDVMHVVVSNGSIISDDSDAGSDGILVGCAADSLCFRNLFIQGGSNGIVASGVSNLVIENSKFFNQGGDGISIKNNGACSDALVSECIKIRKICVNNVGGTGINICGDTSTPNRVCGVFVEDATLCGNTGDGLCFTNVTDFLVSRSVAKKNECNGFKFNCECNNDDCEDDNQCIGTVFGNFASGNGKIGFSNLTNDCPNNCSNNGNPNRCNDDILFLRNVACNNGTANFCGISVGNIGSVQSAQGTDNVDCGRTGPNLLTQILSFTEIINTTVDENSESTGCKSLKIGQADFSGGTYSITAAGNYHLSENVTGRVNITADNVTFDLCGYEISTSSDHAIVMTDVCSVTVQNGSISDDAGFHGIVVESSTAPTITTTSVCISDIKVVGRQHGILLDTVEKIRVKKYFGCDNEYGVRVICCKNVLVINAQIDDSTEAGMRADTDSALVIVRDSQLTDNKKGFEFIGVKGASFVSSFAIKNTGKSKFPGDAGYDIKGVSREIRLEACVASGYDQGFLSEDSSMYCERCLAEGNMVGFKVVGNSTDLLESVFQSCTAKSNDIGFDNAFGDAAVFCKCIGSGNALNNFIGVPNVEPVANARGVDNVDGDVVGDDGVDVVLSLVESINMEMTNGNGSMESKIEKVGEKVCEEAESVVDVLGVTIADSTDTIMSKLCVVESKVEAICGGVMGIPIDHDEQEFIEDLNRYKKETVDSKEFTHLKDSVSRLEQTAVRNERYLSVLCTVVAPSGEGIKVEDHTNNLEIMTLLKVLLEKLS